MNMLDRIALAKAGYKKKEIEEMLAADNEETQPAVENPEKEEALEDIDQEEEIITEKQENSEDVSDITEDELIEELQNKVLDLEKKLSNAQANNINRDRNIENPIEKAEQKLYDVISNFG